MLLLVAESFLFSWKNECDREKDEFLFCLPDWDLSYLVSDPLLNLIFLIKLLGTLFSLFCEVAPPLIEKLKWLQKNNK